MIEERFNTAFLHSRSPLLVIQIIYAARVSLPPLQPLYRFLLRFLLVDESVENA